MFLIKHTSKVVKLEITGRIVMVPFSFYPGATFCIFHFCSCMFVVDLWLFKHKN